MNRTRNILILGGTRFIGRALCDTLRKDRNNHVFLFHRGVHEFTFDDSNVTHIHGDRLRKDDLGLLRHYFFDYVFDISGEQFQMVELSVEVLKQRCGKYVFCSSSSVYQRHSGYSYTETDLLDDTSADEYVRNKVLSEKYIIDKMDCYLIFRPSKVYGPNNYIEREHWYYKKIMDDEVITISGNPVLHLTYVTDVASGFLYALRDDVSNQVYNISGPEYIALIDYIHLIGRLLSKTVNFRDGIEFAVPYSKVQSRIINHEKLSTLGWKPQINIESGLKKTFKTYDYEK